METNIIIAKLNTTTTTIKSVLNVLNMEIFGKRQALIYLDKVVLSVDLFVARQTILKRQRNSYPKLEGYTETNIIMTRQNIALTMKKFVSYAPSMAPSGNCLTSI